MLRGTDEKAIATSKSFFAVSARIQQINGVNEELRIPGIDGHPVFSGSTCLIHQMNFFAFVFILSSIIRTLLLLNRITLYLD